jgi:hypothetical protein
MLSKSEALELAKRNIIGGTPVKDWVNDPYGAFAETVRQTVDPHFGTQNRSRRPRKSRSKLAAAYGGEFSQ